MQRGSTQPMQRSSTGQSSAIQEQLKILQQKVEHVELNAIKMQAHMEARVQEAERRCAEMAQQSPSEDATSGHDAIYLKKSTAVQCVLSAVLALYCQKTLSSGPVSKLSYSKAMRHIHLLMGGSLIGSIATVQMARRSEGLEKKRLMDAHKATGVAMLAAIVLRMLLRLRSPIPERFPGPKVFKLSETLSHYVFYLLMLALPASGMTYVYFNGSGIPLVGLSKENIEEEDMDTAQQALEIHNKLGKAFEYAWLPFHFASMALHSSRGRSVIKRITPFP